MRKTIQLGGDTDTNAAIVGGMIGALVGFKNLPEFMVNKVLDFDCEKDDVRPAFLSVNQHVMLNIKKLISCRPTDKTQITI